MTDRIDHAAEARRLLDVADLRPSANWEAETGERKADILAAAQVQAALALVEQQRIGNDLLREVVNHVTGANN